MMLRRSFAAGILYLGIGLALPIPILKHGPPPEYFLYIGSKSKEAGKGIYAFRFNPADGAISPVEVTGGAGSYEASLARHPSNKFLYAITGDGSVAAFAVHKDTGSLRFLNKMPTKGKDPCLLAVEHKGWMLFAANCGSGDVESFRVAGDGGILDSTGSQAQPGSANAKRYTLSFSPDNLFLFVARPDKIYQYHLDATKEVFFPNDPATMAAKARALAFRGDEKFAYAADEAGSAVDTLAYNREKGNLSLLGSTPVKAGHPVAIVTDAAGKFAYTANAGDDSIGILAIDGKHGTLKEVRHVAAGCQGPDSIQFDPTGRYLFVGCEESSRVLMFEIDRKSGAATAAGKPMEVPKPSGLQFVPVSGPEIH
jgi:6-phosphogluconolactonase